VEDGTNQEVVRFLETDDGDDKYVLLNKDYNWGS
jgi:hypothetical protein